MTRVLYITHVPAVISAAGAQAGVFDYHLLPVLDIGLDQRCPQAAGSSSDTASTACGGDAGRRAGSGAAAHHQEGRRKRAVR